MPNYAVVGDANGSVLSGTHITIAQVTSRSLSTVDQEIAIQVIRQKMIQWHKVKKRLFKLVNLV